MREESKKEDKTEEYFYVSFELMAQLKVYSNFKRKFSQEYRLKYKKLLEEFHQKVGELQNEYKKEIEELERNKVELEEKIKEELGEEYSILDVCHNTGKLLRKR